MSIIDLENLPNNSECHAASRIPMQRLPTVHARDNFVTECSSNKNLPESEANGFPPVISLNVGGYHFTTRVSTLCKVSDSMLAAMFSGRHRLDKDAHGCYFIDSNGEHFLHILEYLRNETLPPNNVVSEVYKDACYYNIDPLVEKLQTSPNVAKMLVKDAHKSLFPNYDDLRDSIIRTAILNATVTRAGEVLIYPFRKEFKAKAPYFQADHVCITDSAHVRVGPWESAADEGDLIRSLEQDFVESGFSIRPHEQKKRCKYYNGQNCLKSVYKITFLF